MNWIKGISTMIARTTTISSQISQTTQRYVRFVQNRAAETDVVRCTLTQELDLVHSRLKDLGNLRLERFAGHLKKLCLRTNYISNLDPKTFHLLTQLEELDLYDNRITNRKKHKNDGGEMDGIKDALVNMTMLS